MKNRISCLKFFVVAVWILVCLHIKYLRFWINKSVWKNCCPPKYFTFLYGIMTPLEIISVSPLHKIFGQTPAFYLSLLWLLTFVMITFLFNYWFYSNHFTKTVVCEKWFFYHSHKLYPYRTNVLAFEGTYDCSFSTFLDHLPVAYWYVQNQCLASPMWMSQK